MTEVDSGVLRSSQGLLSAAKITKRFNAFVAVADVDFRLDAGEAVGIVGPNGAGKTTLLNVLAGRLRAVTAGTITFNGTDVSALGRSRALQAAESRARTRFRDPFGDMTVFENVFVGASMGGGFRSVQQRLRERVSTRSGSAACSTLSNRARRKRLAYSTASA